MGFVGAILRYLLELAFAGASLPFGTLLINVVGCFALVIVNGFVGRRLHVGAGLVRAMGTGLLGAFTTLSAFTAETIEMLSDGRFGMAAAYITVTFVLCFLAALAGSAADDVLAKRRMRKLMAHHREHHEQYLKEHR